MGKGGTTKGKAEKKRKAYMQTPPEKQKKVMAVNTKRANDHEFLHEAGGKGHGPKGKGDDCTKMTERKKAMGRRSGRGFRLGQRRASRLRKKKPQKKTAGKEGVIAPSWTLEGTLSS